MTDKGPSRNPASRAEYIVQELLQHGQVAVEQLSAALGVDASTIRRDLEKLERQRLLKRVHGGAVPLDTMAYSSYGQDLTFQENSAKQIDEKAAIALAATKLIQPNEAISVSPGTTTTQLVRTIRQLQIQNLTIVTNAVNIAMELASLRGINLIVSGGMVLPDFFAMVGPLAEQTLRELYVSCAFVGVSGISPEQGLTSPNQLEALSHRTTIEHAQKTVVLADHTKFGRVALHRIAPARAIHTLITDHAAPDDMVKAFEAQGIVVVRAGKVT